MSYWTPGAVEPYEAVTRGGGPKDVEAVYGEVGKPSSGVTLTATIDDARVRVTTVSGSYLRSQGAEEFATFLLANDGGEVRRRASGSMSLPSTTVAATTFFSDAWFCTFAGLDTRAGVFVVGPMAISGQHLSIQPVTDWDAYGVDLTVPQSATSLSRQMWEPED